MPAQTTKRGGLKLRRSSKHAHKYATQLIRTASNKARRQRKRIAKRDQWRLVGKKKNGQPVFNALREETT